MAAVRTNTAGRYRRLLRRSPISALRAMGSGSLRHLSALNLHATQAARENTVIRRVDAIAEPQPVDPGATIDDNTGPRVGRCSEHPASGSLEDGAGGEHSAAGGYGV